MSRRIAHKTHLLREQGFFVLCMFVNASVHDIKWPERVMGRTYGPFLLGGMSCVATFTSAVRQS